MLTQCFSFLMSDSFLRVLSTKTLAVEAFGNKRACVQFIVQVMHFCRLLFLCMRIADVVGVVAISLTSDFHINDHYFLKLK